MERSDARSPLQTFPVGQFLRDKKYDRIRQRDLNADSPPLRVSSAVSHLIETFMYF